MFGVVSKFYSTEWQWPTFGTRSTRAYAVGLSTYENPNPADGAIFDGVVVAQETAMPATTGWSGQTAREEH